MHIIEDWTIGLGRGLLSPCGLLFNWASFLAMLYSNYDDKQDKSYKQCIDSHFVKQEEIHSVKITISDIQQEDVYILGV